MRKPSIIGLFIVCACLNWAQTPSPLVKSFIKVDAPTVALTHVRVIDGTGAAARENQTIILANGKITAVGDDSGVYAPKDAQVLDLHGYTVIPGSGRHA